MSDHSNAENVVGDHEAKQNPHSDSASSTDLSNHEGASEPHHSRPSAGANVSEDANGNFNVPDMGPTLQASGTASVSNDPVAGAAEVTPDSNGELVLLSESASEATVVNNPSYFGMFALQGSNSSGTVHWEVYSP